MLNGEKIVIISDVDWDGHWVCEQQTASILSEENLVIYVEQTRTLLSFFRKSGGDIHPLEKVRLIRKGLQRRTDNLFVISPPMILPFRYLPLIYEVNQKFRAKWLKKLLERIGIKRPIVITFERDSSAMVKSLSPKLSVYYRNDNHDKRGLWFNPSRFVSRRESEVMRTVDVVCALSNGLAAKSRSLDVKTYVVPNGADIELFMRAGNEHAVEPGDVVGIPRPRIGVVGMLDYRIDVKLLDAIARRHPEWSILMVGPVNSADQRSYEGLISLKNVFFLGQKPVRDVPLYMKALDVGLIPYKLDEYTKAILSLKIFEYSAAGVPTIATPMPELFAYSDTVRIADGAVEFEGSICDALRSHTRQESAQLINFAAGNTWRCRVQQISEIIARQINRDPSDGSRTSP